MRRVPLHSKSTAATMEEEEEEEEHLENSNNSSCYYPGCKKDANCSCEICLASINATLDLMPMSIHKSSLTKLSASKPNNNLECTPTPISFDASHLSTPKSTASHILPSSTPAIKSTARSSLVFNQKIHNEKEDKKKGKQWCFTGLNILRILLGLGFLLCADIVFPKIVSGIIRPALSPELVKRVGEKCWHVQDLNGKLRFLQKELASVVDGKVSNCSHVHSLWKISKDGVLLNSRCTLYKSAIEEVTVWGWPLQTSGLLTTGFSSTTFTILSGRLSEWNGGHVSYLVRKANASWVQPKWGASVVQLHPNTWILQYQRSYCTRLHSAALDFLKSRISRIVGRVKKSFWMLAAVEDTLYNEFRANNGIKIPT
ncbi:hypothetical protein HN51_057001 [Arachis hypogaea]|uniref:ERG2/sigma1 receptor-like protein n=1 Tax=Arachis hypogaea TaxID=3818 RepID=A0A444XVZ3_ARAHY|nr:uncharacterized protein LOC107616642 isoform X1 [Arachis ipaensis]XP_025679751.1 uncharacterized protein LOC112779635 isoform X1 [Arachis hypogaea]QHN79985.1 uncharacterized protein DS421_19g674600 [Arachis hypogaea]RYQ93923.1 hypothetical protein Ahy_B09g100140 [Arachis hypogaea]